MSEPSHEAYSSLQSGWLRYGPPVLLGVGAARRAWRYQIAGEGDLVALFLAAAALSILAAVVRRFAARPSQWILVLGMVVYLIPSTIIVARHDPPGWGLGKVAFLALGVLLNVGLVWLDHVLINRTVGAGTQSTDLRSTTGPA